MIYLSLSQSCHLHISISAHHQCIHSVQTFSLPTHCVCQALVASASFNMRSDCLPSIHTAMGKLVDGSVLPATLGEVGHFAQIMAHISMPILMHLSCSRVY